MLRAPIARFASPADCTSARPNTPPPPLVVDPLGPVVPLQPPMPIAPMIQSSFFMMPPRTWVTTRYGVAARHTWPGPSAIVMHA